MIKNGAIIGTIVGLVVVGARVLYAKYYGPDTGSVYSFSPSEQFAERPSLWIAFGLPFGAIIGTIIGMVFNYLDHYGLARWPIVNAIWGGTLGWFVVIAFITAHFVIFTIAGAFKNFWKGDTGDDPDSKLYFCNRRLRSLHTGSDHWGNCWAASQERGAMIIRGSPTLAPIPLPHYQKLNRSKSLDSVEWGLCFVTCSSVHNSVRIGRSCPPLDLTRNLTRRQPLPLVGVLLNPNGNGLLPASVRLDFFSVGKC